MSNLLPLIKNECIKIIKRKRFYVVLLVLLVLVPMFTYAQMKSAERSRRSLTATGGLSFSSGSRIMRIRLAVTGSRMNGNDIGKSLFSRCSIICSMM